MFNIALEFVALIYKKVISVTKISHWFSVDKIMLNKNSMLKKMTISLMFVGVAASAMAVTAASNNEPVSVQLKAFKRVVDSKGNAQFKAADSIKPQDVIEYRATYTNNTTGNIKSLKATLPIPADTQYLGASLPSGALGSTDGVNFATMPLKKKVDGKLVNIPLKEYRALQWQIAELPAKKAVTVSAQAKVNTSND